jgi:drug/metabolite transporter (DMT)-like permease
VALVVRPAFVFGGVAAPLDAGAVAAALGGAALTAIAYVGVRELSRTEHPLVIVLWFPLVAAPAALPATLAQGLWPTPTEWALLAGIGVLAQLGQVWLTRGLALETAGRATALSYLQIAFAVLWGWLFFAELPGPWAAVGAAFIGAGTWIGARAAARATAAASRDARDEGPSPNVAQ